MNIDLTIFHVITLFFTLVFALLKSKNGKNDLLIKLHFAILSIFTLLGTCSLIFALLGIHLTLKNINNFLIPLLTTILLWIRIGKSNRKSIVFSMPTVSRRSWFLFFTSYSLAALAGLLFFSIELVPSSMTGDPGRHFIHATQWLDTESALVYKPIYYIATGIFLQTFHSIPQDEAFVIFNIFSLGLCTWMCGLLFVRLFPSANFYQIGFVLFTTCFSYPYFSLIYGYYTILLGSVFLFGAMFLLIEHKGSVGKRKYFLPTVAVVGLTLTHSYLLPDAVLSMLLFALWISNTERRQVSSELADLAPFLITVAAIAIVSNGLFGQNSLDGFKTTLTLQGYVNESLVLNLIPFFPLALAYLLRYSEKQSAQILLLYLSAAALFSLFMDLLHRSGHAAPYYVNRNQLVLIPLLIIAGTGFLIQIEKQRSLLIKSTIGLVVMAIAGPLIFLQPAPLSTSVDNFRKLLTADYFVYTENIINVKSSPLQMTAQDREMMRRIGRHESDCIDNDLRYVATIGTDHEVSWFQIYTNIYPSLFYREDGFIDFSNYEKNYNIWKHGAEHNYIVVLSHFDFWRRNDIISEIKARAFLTCKGDSIEIYRKHTDSGSTGT